ncbi:MAG: BREX-1 system adenine-specific DNA-methyltransferase PglX [Methanosarcina sp.]|nr:BREX-1 system adenine-specific DNA-methyltransferase PglX [Methanosarcina sp.]
MKLAEHVEQIRQIIDQAFRNTLGRMGITDSARQPLDNIPQQFHLDRIRIDDIFEPFTAKTGSTADAYEKLVEELTFTLFNRLAALKVMEAHGLNSPILTRSSQHGDRSFAHFLWLEQNPEGRDEEQEGLLPFIEEKLNTLSADIPLFSPQYPYHLLPTAIELRDIIDAFNAVAKDEQVEPDIWKSDDVLGWLYESYNNYKKVAHKDSKAKTEYDKVSIQSQVYTPSWVVKFLVDNSLGKLYLEMFPDSTIKEKYKIANTPTKPTRERKPLTEIRLIDPACGSGNFLLYAFDLLYDLYIDQIDNYGADYDDDEILELIIRHNLHGIDIDDRAVQLAQLGLHIKVKRQNRSAKIEKFNIVSSDFFLPDYPEVKHLFENGGKLSPELENIVTEMWDDLQQAYKFGSLIRLEEKFSLRMQELVQQWDEGHLFKEDDTLANYEQFRENFFTDLRNAVAHNTAKHGISFLNTKAGDAISFLELLTQKYDVAVANPPYTDSGDFGPELKKFINANYKKPYKFHSNLYATFIKRCYEFVDEKGKIALVHPPTFMYIKSFEDVRKFIIDKMHINLFVEWGYLGMFNPLARVDSAMFVLEKETKKDPAVFIKLNDLYEGERYDVLFDSYEGLLNKKYNNRIYFVDQYKLKIIEGWPFIYWISDGFREKFKNNLLRKKAKIVSGIKTGNNEGALRYWWELNITDSGTEWFKYAKGGSFNKWYGNVWIMLNSRDNFSFLRSQNSYNIPREEYLRRQGVTYNGSGSKGVSFRLLENDTLYDMGSSAIFSDTPIILLAILNTKLVYYITDCLNPTVNKQPNDSERIPFVKPTKAIEELISTLAVQNIKIKKHLCSYHIIETNFDKTALTAGSEPALRDRLLSYLNYENAQLTLVLINEAIINQLIFDVYELSPEDRLQVENKKGKSVGELPVLTEARDAYLASTTIENETVREFIQKLPVTTFNEEQIHNVKNEFTALYQSNNDLEEFCIRHQLNPINVWYCFRESLILPPGRAAEIALEFLADTCRTVLMEDEDGIISLVGLPGESGLLDRLEHYYLNNGFTSAQFSQLDEFLGRPINEYLEHHFFKDLSNHLNLFM